MSLGPTSVPCIGVQLIWHPSPNFGPRKGGLTPSLIVLHYTAMASAEAAIDRLCDPEFEVSAHYLIAQGGEVYQLVSEDMRAWHAGAGGWGDINDVNSASIGIESCNRGDHPFPEVQIAAVKDLIRDVRERWGIPAARVIGHSDMAPARKQDPGRLFPWDELAREGLAVFRGQPHEILLNFLAAAEQFGYKIEDEKQAQELILEAFRQRFRPDAMGPLGPEDVKILSDLALTYPCRSRSS